jgi:Tfp pilus assembly protein PilZ
MKASERRRYNRYEFQEEIGHILHPSNSEKIYTGILVNISCAGMCLYVSNPVILGQEITIKRENQYYIKGRVVWCNEMGERSHPYKVGLKFAIKHNTGKLAQK